MAALCASLSNIVALCASFVYTAILSLFRSGGQFPYQLLTRKVNAEQSSAIVATLLSRLPGLAHGEVHYPCGLGTMNSDSVRAEVHYPEGFDRGLTLCDQKCQFGFYTKRVSATVGYLPS